MRHIMLFIAIVIVVLGTNKIAITQSTDSPKRRDIRSVEEIEKHPELGIDYEKVAIYKLTSSKTTYRIGDKIELNLFLANNSSAPIFFIPPFFSPVITVQNDKKEEVEVNTYRSYLRHIGPESFVLIQPNENILGSDELLIGCETPGFENGSGKISKRAGDSVLYPYLINRGRACIALMHPGKYTLRAMDRNDDVLVAPDSPNVKTAVGIIRSSSLTITVVE